MSDRKRLLNDLRVIDLRVELEKRNLDKSGVRGILIERLSKHLVEEGHDPATFKFDTTAPEPKTPKRVRRTESTADETPAMEDMIVQDDVGEEETETKELSKSNCDEEQPKEMEVDESKVSRKREASAGNSSPNAKKPCLEEKADVKDVKTEDEQKNNEPDTEDSINLDIGDDELLNEETEHASKIKNEEPEDVAEPADDVPEDAADDTTTADLKEEVKSEDAATSEHTEEKKDNEQTDDKDNEGDDKKEKKEENKEGGARNLWVSGLSGDTRAKDLKQLCSKHGKVIGAKVVTNARTPGSRCYGYVTMVSAQDAENCIKYLHRSELHGRMISVEKAKSETDSAAKKQTNVRQSDQKEGKEEVKDEEAESKEEEKNGEKKPKGDEEPSGADSNRSTSQNRDRSHRPERDYHNSRSRDRRPRERSPREILSFSKIRKEREVARMRERGRAEREEERRRRAAEDALRERERRQRQEKHRLALERDALRAEREKIEREKNELLRLERERHRLEREKLELERLELKRAQMRLEEERRKRATYESREGRPPGREGREGREGGGYRKSPTAAYKARPFEAPPPPRFELATPAYERPADKRDYVRHLSSSSLKYPTNGTSSDDPRQPLPPGTRPKEPSRSYESRDSRSYRASPSKPEPRSWNMSRYQESGPTPKNSGVSESWGGGGGGGGGGGAPAAAYDSRYAPSYQPPPPGASYPDRYQPPRDYRPKY